METSLVDLVQLQNPVYTFEELIFKTTRRARMTNPWLRRFLPPFLIHVPIPIAMLQAWLFEMIFPVGSPLRISRDQIRMLTKGNVVGGVGQAHEPKTLKCIHPQGVAVPSEQDCKQALFRGLEDHLKSVDDVFEGGQWKDTL